MEAKLYIRDGKCFKYVPNMLGMYWNGFILTKERMQDNIAMVDSIAVVIEQHYDHVVMASLTKSKLRLDWYEAKNWCKSCFNGNGRLPSNTELINLKKYITLGTIAYIWGEENSNYTARGLGWGSGDLVSGNKNESYCAMAVAVTDVPILDLI